MQSETCFVNHELRAVACDIVIYYYTLMLLSLLKVATHAIYHCLFIIYAGATTQFEYMGKVQS
jgi:hypothetical protein